MESMSKLNAISFKSIDDDSSDIKYDYPPTSSNVQNKVKEVESKDLDVCVQNILEWEQYLTNFNTQVQDLTKEKESLTAQINFLHENGSVDKAIISDLQSTIKTLQDILHQRLDQEETLRSLQEKLLIQERKTQEAEEKFESETKLFNSGKKMLQEKHNQELSHLRQEVNDSFMEKEKQWNEALTSVKSELEKECNKNKEVEKKHEKEVVKMQLEYEKKIALLQVQSSRLHSNSNNVNATNSEVFRKKLQHIQEESSKEINRLKQEVSLLQLKLSAKVSRDENRNSPQLMGSRPGILKRRR